MNRAIDFPTLVKRELQRLSATEVAALRANDLPSYVHSRLRWSELVLTSAPQLVAAAPRLGFHVAHLLPGADRPIPRWKLELLARPLVPIVRRKLTTQKIPGGGFAHGAIETLACGHTHNLIVLLEGDLRARRRRCKQCGAIRLATMDSRQDSTLSQEVKHGSRRLNG
jgi:hypothetical protein